jgi:hypothetical protein
VELTVNRSVVINWWSRAASQLANRRGNKAEATPTPFDALWIRIYFIRIDQAVNQVRIPMPGKIEGP